jgi:hypothetical protein
MYSLAQDRLAQTRFQCIREHQVRRAALLTLAREPAGPTTALRLSRREEAAGNSDDRP